MATNEAQSYLVQDEFNLLWHVGCVPVHWPLV